MAKPSQQQLLSRQRRARSAPMGRTLRRRRPPRCQSRVDRHRSPRPRPPGRSRAQARVERLEPLCRPQQQPWRVAAPLSIEAHLRTRQLVHPRDLSSSSGPASALASKYAAACERARMRTSRTRPTAHDRARRAGSPSTRSPVPGRPLRPRDLPAPARGPPSARARPPRPRPVPRRPTQVPRTAVGVQLRIAHLRQRLVHAPPSPRRRPR